MGLPRSHPTLGGKETARLPNTKKPKTRPPRGWRDQVLFPVRSLPTYTGPYPVATMEIEVPAREPRTFSHIKRDGRHMLELETVLMTVYYPTDNTSLNLKEDQSKYSRELWLGRPRIDMARGYGVFSGLGYMAVPVFLPSMFTKLPAFRNAPIARHWAPPTRADSEGFGMKAEAKAGFRKSPKEPKFPLVLFSHGLGGTRTMYSSVCGEFASYGFVVCAVEHRDGSGPRTFVNHAKSGPGSMENNETDAGVDHTSEERSHGYDTIDYLFPKDNPSDTSPHNEKGVDRELRSAQIALRMAEIGEAYDVLQEICKGKGQEVADRNLRRKGYKGASSKGLDGIDWTRWKDRIRLDYVTAAGHSFGAATVVEILRHDSRFNYVSQGIIYDIWGAGMIPPDQKSSRIRAPLLAINSEAFTYWPSNFDLVKSLVEEAQDEPNPKPSWLVTLRGTVHISQSDFSIMYPHLCSLFLKAVANPKRALDLNINASLEFLSQVLPADLAEVCRAHPDEGILESKIQPLDRIPSALMHKPPDEWIAARLKIRHEWLFRISPKLFRKLHRIQNQRKGKPLETGDETWLHTKPSPESIENHLREHGQGSNADQQTEERTKGHRKAYTGEEDDGEPVHAPPRAGPGIPGSTSVNQDP